MTLELTGVNWDQYKMQLLGNSAPVFQEQYQTGIPEFRFKAAALLLDHTNYIESGLEWQGVMGLVDYWN
jgi:hypothetical protein